MARRSERSPKGMIFDKHSLLALTVPTQVWILLRAAGHQPMAVVAGRARDFNVR
jgi:hypothetical protein